MKCEREREKESCMLFRGRGDVLQNIKVNGLVMSSKVIHIRQGTHEIHVSRLQTTAKKHRLRLIEY